MMENALMNLGILFFFAIIGGIIASRFKQPAGIGLLIVGAVIGPHALGFVNNQGLIDMMIEAGSILLLFVVGLEFVIPKLIRIGFKAMMIGALKIGIIFFMTYMFFILLGMKPAVAVLFGVILSISSTVVIIKILEAKGLCQREEIPLLLGVLLIEDIFSVFVLTLISRIVESGGSMIPVVEKMIISMTVLVVAYIVALKIGKAVVSWFVKNSNDEAVTFIALAICVGFSGLTYYLGLSPATGAFLAGSVVASLNEVRLFEKAIRPYTLTFGSLFFISVGTMVNLGALKDNIFLVLALLVLVIISRFIAVGIISHLFASFDRNQVIFSSIAMICVSEFSLLIAQQATKLNLGIDFVSITASLIFFTAMIMSISIGYYSRLPNLLNNYIPSNWTDKPKSLSLYIKHLFDEIDLDNTNTIRFKRLFFATSGNTLFMMFLLFGWRRLAVFLLTTQAATWTVYALHAVFTLIMMAFIYWSSQSLKRMHAILIEVITNLDCQGNSRKSRFILNNLLRVLGLFITILFMPVIVVLLHLPIWVNAFLVVMLLYVVLQMKRVLKFIHNHIQNTSIYEPYRKLDSFKFKMSADADEFY
jgi:CPA2 family monovalent cation:H+ antiporter-2